MAGPYRVSDQLTWQERVAALGALAVAGTRSPAVRALAQRARDITTVRPDGTAEISLARSALAVVQATGYHEDPKGEEWFQDAYWTVSHGGDCEDLAVLFVSVCMVLGIQARIIWIEQPGRQLNHVTSMVMIGGKLYWADASIAGAQFGENPYAAIARLHMGHIVGSRKVR